MIDLTIVQWSIAAAVSVFVAGVGYSQYRAANRKFVFDLFEERYEIYSIVRGAVAAVTAAGKLDSKAEWELGKAVERAYFFFGNDALNYLKALQNDVSELTILEAERPALSNPSDLKANLEASRKAKERVFAFYHDGQPIFAKYMRFDQRL